MPDLTPTDSPDNLAIFIQDLVQKQNSDVKTFNPIQAPQDGVGLGSYWFDSATEKVMVQTSSGPKALKYE